MNRRPAPSPRLWLAGALFVGLLSQWCVNYGVCALPL